jgi:hypothetical protein
MAAPKHVSRDGNQISLRGSGRRPPPIADLRQIGSVFDNVTLVFNELVSNGLLYIDGGNIHLRHPVDDVANEMEAIEPVAHHHVEGGGRRAFFLIAAHMHIVMVCTLIDEPVNERWITVKGEDYGPIFCKKIVEVVIGQSMRMLRLRLQGHQVNDIDNADFDTRRIAVQKVDGR